MKLYVGNLPFQTTEADLRDLFGQYGTVTDAVVMLDKMSGRSRGFGFVTMSSAEEGTAATNAANGLDLGGRNITVNERVPARTVRLAAVAADSVAAAVAAADSAAGVAKAGGGFGGGRREGGGYGGGGRREGGGYGGGGRRDRY